MNSAAIYDPQLLSCQGIRTVLDDNPKVKAVEILDASQPLGQQLAKQSHDLVVFDYSLFSAALAQELHQVVVDFPHVHFLVISDNDDPMRVRQFISAGIKGFLTKRCSEEEIQTALKLIQDGGKFYCQSVIELIADQEQNPELELSEREMEIIHLVTQGNSSAQIADQLHVSIHTVNSHRKNILKKLGLKSPTELIIYAVKQGWVNL